jgi:hypothetical protein
MIAPISQPREDDGDVVTIRPRALRVVDAAKYIGIGRTKMFELIKAGRVDARHNGGVVIVTVASLDAYLDSLPDAREAKLQ